MDIFYKKNCFKKSTTFYYKMSERFNNSEDYNKISIIVYELDPEEKKRIGILSIGSYCRCFDKSQCDCLQKLKNWYKIPPSSNTNL